MSSEKIERSERVESRTRVVVRTGTVIGRVTDEQTQGPITAAQVFIPSLDTGGLTQRNGHYLLQNVPPGKYTLSIARIGYQTIQMEITLDSGRTVEQDVGLSDRASSSPDQFVPTPDRLVPARR